MKDCYLSITNWKHYYISIHFIYENRDTIHLKRKINKEDLKSGEFDNYSLKDTTERFLNSTDAIKAAILYFKKYLQPEGYILDIEGLFDFNRSISYWKRKFPKVKFRYSKELWMK